MLARRFSSITKINLDTDRISEEEKQIRRELRAKQPPPSGEENPDIYTITGTDRSFKLKKAAHDSFGSIVGYHPEEALRTKYFYPYLPCVVFDIGASFGIWTLPAISFGAFVCAFEPDPRHLISLKENIIINGYNENVVIIEKALWSKHGTTNIDELEDVPVTTVDHFIESSHIVPDYIKIDVDGVELGVIQGAEKTLALFKPKLFVEIHSDEKKRNDQDEISDLLKPLYNEEKIPLSEYVSHSFFIPKS